MSTIISNFFSINGVISTDKTVMQNINALCDATGVFLTYDVNEGHWSVVINAITSSSWDFNDSNIIGEVNLSGSNIHEMYNSVSYEFPHKDIRDQTDYVEFKIPDEDRFPNELDNKLVLSTDLVNDSAVAQYLAAVELKQSRLDKVINFKTDYTAIGIRAGDVVTVTNDALGFSAKQFRLTKVEEDEQNELLLNITALEYDASIYSTAGLIRTYRSKKTGITPKSQNSAASASDYEAIPPQVFYSEQTRKQDFEDMYWYKHPELVSANDYYFHLHEYGHYNYYNKNMKVLANKSLIAGVRKNTSIPQDIIFKMTQDNMREPPDIVIGVAQPYDATVDIYGQQDYSLYVGKNDWVTNGAVTSVEFWPPLTDASTCVLHWGGDTPGNVTTPGEPQQVRLNLNNMLNYFPQTRRYIIFEIFGFWPSDATYTEDVAPDPCKLTALTVQTGATGTEPTLDANGNFVIDNYNAVAWILNEAEKRHANIQHGTINSGSELNPAGAGKHFGYYVFDTLEFKGYFTGVVPYDMEHTNLELP